MSALGSTLAELKRYDDAAAALHQAVNLKPHEKKLHRQLGGVYSRAENQPKSYEEMVVYISLERGTPAENAAEAVKKAPANSDAAKILASLGRARGSALLGSGRPEVRDLVLLGKEPGLHAAGRAAGRQVRLGRASAEAREAGARGAAQARREEEVGGTPTAGRRQDHERSHGRSGGADPPGRPCLRRGGMRR